MVVQENSEYKKHAIDTFITAGIAFYLKGDWRGIFARCKIPEYQRWKSKEKTDMQRALDIFFN